MSRTNLLPEREYIAILALVVPLVSSKQDMKLTPGDFDSLAYAKEVIEALAIQRLEQYVPAVDPENPPAGTEDDPQEPVDKPVDKPVDEVPAEEPAEVEPNDPAD